MGTQSILEEQQEYEWPQKESEDTVRAFLNYAWIVVVSLLAAADVKCACGAFVTASLFTHFRQ